MLRMSKDVVTGSCPCHLSPVRVTCQVQEPYKQQPRRDSFCRAGAAPQKSQACFRRLVQSGPCIVCKRVISITMRMNVVCHCNTVSCCLMLGLGRSKLLQRCGTKHSWPRTAKKFKKKHVRSTYATQNARSTVRKCVCLVFTPDN